jgi:hypothetical protein
MIEIGTTPAPPDEWREMTPERRRIELHRRAASRPLVGRPVFDAIAATVREIVLSRRGAANAVTGDQLVRLVSIALHLDGWLAEKTILRRAQESIAAMVAAGEQIASTSADGYYVPETKEEIAAGRRDLAHRLGSLARRFRAYDAATADRILALLGQGALDMERAA